MTTVEDVLKRNFQDVEPPVGIIRAFAVDDSPAEVRGTLDLKTRGTRLFVDCARVFALAHGIHDTGTASRLRLAGAALDVAPRHVEATVEAFHFLQFLRLRQQDVTPAGAAANRIDPYALNEVSQRMLREADFTFRQALAFCPYSPEAVFRYTNLLLSQARYADGLLVAEAALRFDRDNVHMQNWGSSGTLRI